MRQFLLFFLSIALLFSLTNSFGQVKNTKGTTVKIRPKGYYPPNGKILPSASDRLSTRLQNAWIVYSDRNNNKTYFDPTLGAEFKTMNFMDMFVVIGETDNALELAKLTKRGEVIEKGGAVKIDKNLEYFGWADKNKLLMWVTALVNEKRYTIKGLSINTLESLRDPANVTSGNDKVLTLYNNPELTVENANDFRMYDFLFIYKETATSYLVGKSYEIKNFYFPQYVILGWVPKSEIQKWDQRLCLEPNWEPDAVAERKEKGIKPQMYPTPEVAMSSMNGQKVPATNVLWEKDPLGVRYKPEVKRFPIINQESPGVFKTGFVSNVMDVFGKEVMTSDDQYSLEEGYNDLRETYRKVNLVIVMDGTEILANSRANILRAINEVASMLTDEMELSESEYKLGAVIYRGPADAKCAGGDKEVRVKNLTNDFESVYYFIDGETRGELDCGNPDLYRSMYKGIGEAMRMLNTHKNEANFILLLGSGGNHPNNIPSAYTPEIISKSLADYMCSIFAIQPISTGDQAQNQFVAQVTDLMNKSASEIQKKNVAAGKYPPGKTIPKAKMQDKSTNTIKLDWPKTSPIPGTLMVADEFNPIQPDTLSEEVVSSVLDVIIVMEKLMNDTEASIKGIGQKPEMNEGMYSFLANMNVDVNLLQKASYSNLQFFTEAYTNNSHPKLKYDLYKYILFLTENELKDLINTMGTLFDPSVTGDKLRENMKNTFQKMIEAYLGSEKVKYAKSRLSVAKLLEEVSGVPINSELLKKYEIADIDDPAIVTDADLKAMVSQMKLKLDELEEVSEDENYYFLSNDIRYYWIPQELMP